jgi:hypothetical protein
LGSEDVVALLDEVEVGEIELPPAGWIVRPCVEIPLVGKVVVDESGEDSRDKGGGNRNGS